MPRYEFVCECGNKIDKIQSVHDGAPICEKCQKEMKKIISGGQTFIIKK